VAHSCSHIDQLPADTESYLPCCIQPVDLLNALPSLKISQTRRPQQAARGFLAPFCIKLWLRDADRGQRRAEVVYFLFRLYSFPFNSKILFIFSVRCVMLSWWISFEPQLQSRWHSFRWSGTVMLYEDTLALAVSAGVRVIVPSGHVKLIMLWGSLYRPVKCK
jgi:hypothetical protein